MKEGSVSLQMGALVINNRYVISDIEKDKLGEGGVGIVYKALDTKAIEENDKYVAIKILHQGLVNDKWVSNKFSKEAKAIVNRIQHQGVVAGKESGVLLDGRPYIIMEYIKGESLRDLIKQNLYGIDFQRSANILKQIGCAITAIHNANVYHRDIKPSNVMLYFINSEEFVKIIDFGIATVKESSDEKTKITQIAGTPAYMAPEQIMEGNPSSKADIYSMGVIAYEMLTGRKPFNIESLSGNAYISLYEMQKQGVKISPKQLRPNLPDQANRLIMQALAFEPNNRFSSAEEFGNKICKTLVEIATVQAPEKKIKNVLPILIALLVLLIPSAIGGYFLLRSYSLQSTLTPTVRDNLNKFNYSVELSEFRNGKWQDSFLITGITIVVHDKDRIWFNLSSENTSYIYLLNEPPTLLNESPKYNILFPADEENNQLLANKEIKLPNKDQAIEAIGTKGVETFWIIWSKKQIRDLEYLRLLPNPTNKGVVQDASKLLSIKELLEKYSNKKVVIVDEDKKAKKVQVSSIEDTIVIHLEIDHR